MKEPTRTQRAWRGMALALCALVLASVAGYYHPDTGFTELIGFDEQGEPSELPALRALPHAHGRAYDGQYYGQLALDPLLRDPAIDRALDAPPYRARRILLSWTAYVLGLGHGPWVLEIFALQNVVCWMLIAWLLTTWICLDSARSFARWTACVCANGLMWSVRLSLVDGPSLLLLACAVHAATSRRRWLTAPILGVSALARETNLLGVSLFTWPRHRREVYLTAAALLAVALPILIWQDYLFSIYRTTALLGSSQFDLPLAGYFNYWKRVAIRIPWPAPYWPPIEVLLPVASTVQAVYLLSRPRLKSAWWRLGAPYVILMLFVNIDVWPPEAISRVLLPMTCAFNVLLADERRAFWPWFVAGNVPLVGTLDILIRPGLERLFA